MVNNYINNMVMHLFNTRALLIILSDWTRQANLICLLFIFSRFWLVHRCWTPSWSKHGSYCHAGGSWKHTILSCVNDSITTSSTKNTFHKIHNSELFKSWRNVQINRFNIVDHLAMLLMCWFSVLLIVFIEWMTVYPLFTYVNVQWRSYLEA